MISSQPLFDQIAAVAPITGLRIGDWADKATWQMELASTATADQVTAAHNVIAAFDPNAPLPVVETVLSQDLMAQFTADDAAKIQAAVAGNPQFWLLWSAMQA